MAGFYLEAVRYEGGCPTVLRTDNGTENTVMASIQSYFRADAQDEHAGIIFCYFYTMKKNQEQKNYHTLSVILQYELALYKLRGFYMEASQLGTRTTGPAHFVGINVIPVNTRNSWWTGWPK